MASIGLPQFEPFSTERRQAGNLLGQVSIVLPLGPNESCWQALIHDLSPVSAQAELVFVAVDQELSSVPRTIAQAELRCPVRWIVAPHGRARQMNRGAKYSTRPYLWFLHADSRVGPDALCALAAAIEAHPHAIHYFDIAYQDDGPALTRLNARGAWLRSHYFGLPFGDQGLCMSRETFQRLGGFDETAAYGEDHLLVWAAHRNRVRLVRVGARITTSARKYHANGWLATTLLHAWRTWRQATPEFVRFLWNRCR